MPNKWVCNHGVEAASISLVDFVRNVMAFWVQLEYQKERDAVDAIMQRIHEEDALSAAAADVKRVETQAFIASFLLQQQQIR